MKCVLNLTIRLMLVFVLCFSYTVSADYTWSAADIISPEGLISDKGFESSSGKIFSNGNVDTVTFKDTKGNTVCAEDKMLQIRPDDSKKNIFKNAVSKEQDINIEFDYYTQETGVVLRCEIRNIATTEITRASQNIAWTGYQYDSSNTITASQWNHFEATVNSKKLIEYYTQNGWTLNDYSNCYILVSVENPDTKSSKTIWIDNVDVYTGDTIVVPLQKPTLTINEVYLSKDNTVLNQNGESGTVYRGVFNDVKSAGQTFKAFTLDNFAFNSGTYSLSFWFKEDAENKTTMTRMWRPCASSENKNLITEYGSNDYFYYVDAASKAAKLGEWKYVSMDFYVDDSNNKELLSGQPITVFWQVRSGEPNFLYSSDLQGDYTVYLSDIKLVKYPVAETTLQNSYPENKAAVKSEDAYILLEYNMPIDISTIKPQNIVINGKKQSKDTVSIAVTDGTVKVNKVGGFVPGIDYNVTITDIYDMFGRVASETFDVEFSVEKDFSYSFAGYGTENPNEMQFKVTNNTSETKKCRLLIVNYSGQNIKKMIISDEFSVSGGETVTKPVDATGISNNYSKKCYLLNIENNAVNTLSDELIIR